MTSIFFFTSFKVYGYTSIFFCHFYNGKQHPASFSGKQNPSIKGPLLKREQILFLKELISTEKGSKTETASCFPCKCINSTFNKSSNLKRVFGNNSLCIICTNPYFYAVTTHLHCLTEAVQMRRHNICFF